MIATPVAQIASILERIAPHLEENTIVTDAGSTKAEIVEQAHRILGEAASRFVPGHPIAGAEKSGPSAAQATLYQNKKVILTPCAHTDPAAIQAIHELWLSTGAIVRQMSPAEHDTVFAAVSHLPHLLAFALVDELAARPDADQFFEFAASGFRDFTRIAGSSPEMWRDISLANRTALLQELDHYQASLARLRQTLEQGNAASLQAIFERASHARNAWAERTQSAQGGN
nr:putative Prephenate dehydrogenase [uncultured marine microorganism HF4000_ANIW137K11]